MRQFAKISPQFWSGQTGRAIRAAGYEAQLVALYVMTSPHATMLGIYYLPLPYLAHDIGLPIEGASKGLRACCELHFCRYDEASEYIWVCNMAYYQVGKQLKAADKRVTAINEAYRALPDLPYLPAFYQQYQAHLHLTAERTAPKKISATLSTFEAPSMPLRSQEKEKEQEKDKDKHKKTEQDNEIEHLPTISQTNITSMPITDVASASLDAVITVNDPIAYVFQHWQQVTGHAHAKLDPKRQRLIRQALTSGYSVAQLCHAISGCSQTPHNMGHNDRGQRYDGLHIILRDADQIDRFIHNYHHPPRPINDAERRSQLNQRVAAEWLAHKLVE
ncbi:MAG: hypothetical protein Tsb005_15010 [Gammaproteobacteria bacterium]